MNFIKFKYTYTSACLYLLFFAAFLTLLCTSAETYAKEEKQAFENSILVFAPTSLTNALHEGLKLFSNQENISASGSFDSSPEISRQLLEGEPANIYITDDATQIRDLQRLGVLNVFSVTPVASDSLVLALPKDSFLQKKLAKLDNLEDKIKLVAKTISLVIPDPDSDPAGKSIKIAFEKMGIWNDVSKKMLRAPNTRNALYLISNGTSPGIIYGSDTASSKDISAVGEIPAQYYDKIIYQASIVAEIGEDSDKDDSEKFIKFLKSPEMKDIFAKYGFKSI